MIAVAGIPKKEYMERRISPALEEVMEARRSYSLKTGDQPTFQAIEGVDRSATIIYPIIVAGDVTGAVVMLTNEAGSIPTETEVKRAQTAAVFLGKQMEE